MILSIISFFSISFPFLFIEFSLLFAKWSSKKLIFKPLPSSVFTNSTSCSGPDDRMSWTSSQDPLSYSQPTLTMKSRHFPPLQKVDIDGNSCNFTTLSSTASSLKSKNKNHLKKLLLLSLRRAGIDKNSSDFRNTWKHLYCACLFAMVRRRIILISSLLTFNLFCREKN